MLLVLCHDVKKEMVKLEKNANHLPIITKK